MTDEEIIQTNEKIDKYNKFSFHAPKLKRYKLNVPLSQPIALAIVSAMLIALPTFLSVATESIWSGTISSTGIEVIHHDR